VRLAYGYLGTVAEAEDVVQDAWLRLERVDADEIRDLQGWLTTTVSRLALDALGPARMRREAYVGPWLPEPIVESRRPSPEERAVQAEDVSLALLVVLESLSANERIAFVLHDIFGYAFDEVARSLQTSPAAARPARLAGAQGGRGAAPALPGHARAAA
jgi:RNA polymerase sigma-70 factor (ECF subfamily)